MNTNEVIARLAGTALGKPVHANDHVNMCQSSNDCIPSAIHVSAVLASRRELLPALEELRAASRGRRSGPGPRFSRPAARISWMPCR